MSGPAFAGLFDDVFRQGVTFCVGGYDGFGGIRTDACELPAQADRHGLWHFHNIVFDGSRCWACWDEADSTCETSFLDAEPSWREVDASADVCKAHAASDTVFSHVVDGRTLVAPPPPQSTLAARVDGIAAGPHATGDTVAVSGSVRDSAGRVRPITGGRFELTAADGSKTTFVGSRRADGTVGVDVKLPNSKSVAVRFVPDPVTLSPNERMGAAVSDASSVQVATCEYRARITAPVSGASLASGVPARLLATLWNADDTSPVSVPPQAALVFSVVPQGAAAESLPAGSTLQTTWTPPLAPTPRSVSISASGSAGIQTICPSAAIAATFSELGLGFAHDLPTRCYTGMDCTGDIRLVRPEPGSASSARVGALLGDPATQVVLSDNRTEVWRGSPIAGDAYRFSRTYQGLGAHSIKLTVVGADGTAVEMPDHQITVRPPLRVVVPAELDLGIHVAGAHWTTACTKLDMSASQAADEHEWELSAVGVDGCVAQPGIGQANSAGRPEFLPLAGGVTQPAFDPFRREFQICLTLPSCAADSAPAGAKLVLRPLTKEFADQKREVSLRWAVKGRSWVDCHAWWLWPTLLTSGLLLLVAGFVRPARFPPGATIRIAGTEAGIRRAAVMELRGITGSRSGFFRDARLGVHLDGNVSGNVRGAPVTVRATRHRGVVMVGGGGVEVLDPGSRKWKPVEDLAVGHTPSTRSLYRVGSTHFQVEPG